MSHDIGTGRATMDHVILLVGRAWLSHWEFKRDLLFHCGYSNHLRCYAISSPVFGFSYRSALGDTFCFCRPFVGKNEDQQWRRTEFEKEQVL